MSPVIESPGYESDFQDESVRSGAGSSSFSNSGTESSLGEEEESPRSVIPVPRSKIMIRQSSVRVHVHSSVETTPKTPERPAVAEPVEKLDTGSQKKEGATPGGKENLKPKPKSRNVRPRSAPPPKKPKPKVEETVDLRSYSKSLRLLGLEIPSNRKEATKLTHHAVTVRTASPTLKTKLRERTQSVSNLQEVIDSKEKLAKKEFKSIKDSLNSAVFEEWYFKKAAEDEKKRQEAERKREEEEEKQREKEEKLQRCSEEFKNWLEKKKSLESKRALSNKAKAGKSKDVSEERKQKIMESVSSWKTKKKEEMLRKIKAQKKAEKEKEEKEKEKEAKMIESAEFFEKWKQRENDKLKEKMKEAREQKLAELEKKREEAVEKRKDAESAFKYWTMKKDELRQKEKERKTRKQRSSRPETPSESEKNQEALKAYNSWLDIVEQRELEEKYMAQENVLRHMWRPPWYPGGIAEF